MILKKFVLILAFFILAASSTQESFFHERENCGISGVVMFPKEKRADWEIDFVRTLVGELLVCTQKRGTGATGVVFFNKNKEAELFKLPHKGEEFVKLKEFEDHVKKITKDTTIIIGHNRAPSVGSPKNNNNNHPVKVDTVYLVHNGDINNHKELFKKYDFKRIGEVDTEVIAQLIAHNSKEKITVESIQKSCLELNGSFAVAFADARDPNHLYLARNTLPATYVVVPELDLLIFNSELELIDKAWEKTISKFEGKGLQKISFKERVEISKNSGVIIDVNAKSVTPFAQESKYNDIVLTEDFENFDAKNWSDVKDKGALKIVDGGHTGKKCLEITATLEENTGGHLYKMLDPGLDRCYLRFYVKFEKEHDYIHHFVHLTGYNPATKWPQGGAGELPEGDKRFSTGIEPWGNWGKFEPPGAWHFYSYWCEMKKSKDDKYWGNSFAPDKPIQVERDKWICVEMMLKCNSYKDKSDGEQAFWIDGKLAAKWDGFKWRTDPKLKVNGIWILYYITESAGQQNHVKEPRKVNKVYFDDIVVARSYIGPIPKK